ncbi:MAG: hypothetical protein KBG20_02430 [Caldilineaceae bacterium]|nr:hypothetical protein [Caldilineaceae bacterium]MBP8106324.1 hypothetical protein [Caldilineaceae bacterium]MBP9071120.1 hypothetical protein [Caldilineaceae bacterium]
MSKSFADEEISSPDEELRIGQYVVILTVHGCFGQEADQQRHLTGFFSSDKEGIITALHGVIGCFKEKESGTMGPCIEITVTGAFDQEDEDMRERGIVTYDCLQVKEVYVAGDIVHLYSPLLGKHRGSYWPNDGLQVNTPPLPFNQLSCDTKSIVDVLVFGFPKRSNAIIKRVVDVLCIRTFGAFVIDRIPEDYYKYLGERKSPDLKTKILNLQGPLEAGDSGSPVIRKTDGTLIGIVLGGVPEELYARWALPWPEKNMWTAGSEVKEELLRIDRLQLPEISNSSFRLLDTLFGFALDDEKVPEDNAFPYISVSNQAVKIGIWPGEISANVYTPKNACIVILTDDFYAEKHAEITKTDISATESPKSQVVPLVRIPTTPVSVYKEFCAQAANNTQVTLYAYLYERVGDICDLPLPTKYDLAYDRFELRTVEKAWQARFCADTDIRDFSIYLSQK